jgi:hypothetical protein
MLAARVPASEVQAFVRSIPYGESCLLIEGYITHEQGGNERNEEYQQGTETKIPDNTSFEV